MREMTTGPNNQHHGYYMSLREDPEFVMRTSSSAYMLTELTPEAQTWLDDNITLYNINHGMSRCWIFICHPDERMLFKLRWYK